MEQEKPAVDTKVEPLKVKKKPRKLANKKTEVAKVDLTKKEETDAVQGETVESVQSTGDSSEESRENTQVEVSHENKNTDEAEVVILQEITPTEDTKEVVKDIEKELKEKPELQLPENVEKLVKFMQDTGGNMEDYIRLNADYTKADDLTLLREYYKKSKPHLDKEEVAKAQGYLDKLKSDYYDEIKMRPGTSQEQQKAVDFFNRYNKEQETAQKRREDFVSRTNTHFTDEFKGFDFSVGEKKFRYQVNNPSDVASKQSNIENFVKRFLDEKGDIVDMAGYHKALYAARNADSLANHFYEQGKADAIRSEYKKSKNISDGSRPTRSGDADIRFKGMKIKAVNGVDSSKLKIKRKT